MKRIALLIVVGIAVACGGVDPASDTAENMAQATSGSERGSALTGRSGHCVYSVGSHTLTGVCVGYAEDDCPRAANVPTCLNNPPSGTFVRSHCGAYVDPYRPCYF